MPLKPTPRRVARHRHRYGGFFSVSRRRVKVPSSSSLFAVVFLLLLLLLATMAWAYYSTTLALIATPSLEEGHIGGGTNGVVGVDVAGSGNAGDGNTRTVGDNNGGDDNDDDGKRRRGNLRGAGGRGRKDSVWVRADSQPFNDQSIASQATHLIVVAGHSVLVSGNLADAGRSDSVWYLLDYQRHRGLPHAIVSHIQAGIRIALEDERGLLVFSGGETRARTGPETEGGSYFRVADALDLWDGRDAFADEDVPKGGTPRRSTVRARAVTEEYATDSFENLLFSVCRFREITGAYPRKISVVSFSFKRQRFETLHAEALRWPMDRFRYIGVDPPASTGFDLEESSEGERKNSLGPFREDPYGCHTEILQRKRKERNPFARKAPYELTCPEMRELLKWCGPQLIPEGRVPWGQL